MLPLTNRQMSILDEYRELVEIRHNIFDKMADKFDEIEKAGYTWQDMVKIDRISAIKLLRLRCPHMSLMECRDYIENFLYNEG